MTSNRTRRSRDVRVLCAMRFVLALVLTSACALAQEGPDPEVLEQLRSEVAALAEADSARREALEVELAAVDARQREADDERRAQQQLRDTIDNGAERVADYQSRMLDIEGAVQTLRSRLGPSPSLEDIEAEIGIVESQRASWTSERSQALDAIASVATDNAAVRDRLAEVTQQLGELEESTASADASLEGRIDTLLQQATRHALSEESKRLQLRVRAESILNNIRTAKVAWLDAAIADADAVLAQLRDAAAERRQSSAMQRSIETRRLIDSLLTVRPEIQALAQRNESLINDQQGLAAQIEAARLALASTRDTRERIEQDANLTRRRLEVAGLEATLGEVMLTRLASLPSTARIDSASRRRNERIAAVSISAIDTEQALRERADRAEYLQQVLGPRDEWGVRERRVSIQLYEQQRELLRENLQAENTLVRLLVDANQADDELLSTIQDYSAFLTGNLLWTRNYAYASPERLADQLRRLSNALLLLKAPASSLPSLYRDPATIALLTALLLLIARRRRIRARLKEMLGKPISPSSESVGVLLSALLLSALKILPIPLLLTLLGRCLHVTAAGDPTLQSVNAALQASALTVFSLSFLRTLGGRLGAGRRLLKWNSAKVDSLLRDMHWLAPLLTIAVGVSTLGRELTPTDSGGPLAAAGSVVLAALLMLAAVRALRTGQFANDYFARYSLRFMALASAAITIMHVSGQLFAAHLYLRALGASIAAVLITLTIISTLQRMLQLYRFRLQQRARESERARALGDEETNDENDESRVSREEALASLSEAHKQLLSLFRLLTLGSLLWLIWSPALPALSFLDEITLWSTTDSTMPDGELRAVTLSVLLLALLTLFITALVTRHLPPLVNVLILEWGKVSAGGRYATGMLLQYLIIGIGLSISFSLLGFEWGKVQWLVAALGVGIGFGLQEIVANFISGLIVLFERPIRVNDIIEAGGNEGVVTRINPRATVIETFEGKEVMVPNKELITNVVTNWSLSSPKLRILVPVGIAYGSDVVEAMRILVDVARENDAVLPEPAPIVTFEDFGDNALTLWLRCYTDREYPVIKSRLRVAIYAAFKEAGIGIAFPQRDVHLDASQPIPVRMVDES